MNWWVKSIKRCTHLYYIEHFLILASVISRCTSISAFASSLGFPIGITSYAIGLEIFVTTAGIQKYKSITEKKKKEHDKIVLLGKSELNNIEVLISKTLIDSSISHDEFVLINNVLKEYDDMKEEIKNLNN